MADETVAVYAEVKGENTELTVFYRDKTNTKQRLDMVIPAALESLDFALSKATEPMGDTQTLNVRK